MQPRARLGLLNIAIFIGGIVILTVSLYPDWTPLLRTVGFPADKLYSPRVQGDLAMLRVWGVVVASLVMLSRLILWAYPYSVQTIHKRIEGFIASASQMPLFIPLSLSALILMKTVLQFLLYFVGYEVYAADDFGRALKADHWLYHRKLDLGWDGWLGLTQTGWLPFSDYLFGLGLAINRDIFLTPKIVNLFVSGIAVVAVYLLGRELFGRTAGFVTAALFAFQPWNVWLGMSGMTSDLPTIVLIALFGLFLFRWLKTDRLGALFAAAGVLFLANGFRYENWLFSGVFSLVIVVTIILRWRQGRLAARYLTAAVGALTVVNVFPIVWMLASYYFLGDWLPALNTTNVSYVSLGSTRPKISIPVLSLTSFPLEIVLSIMGVALFLRSDGRKSFRVYLSVLAATFLLFALVVKGQLPVTGAGVSRNLLPFIVFLLPFIGFLSTRLLRAPEPERNQSVLAGFLILLVIGTFDIIRAFNYPDGFPKDAIYAGWTLRGLQKTGTIPENGKILIERAKDWGDLSIVALAGRPERFVALKFAYPQPAEPGDTAGQPTPAAISRNERLWGNGCERGFQTDACRSSLMEEKFNLVILSSPDRVRSFQETFLTRSWTVGRYYIFEMNAGRPHSRGVDMP